MCQGFSHFSGLMHRFVLAKLATTSIEFKVEAMFGGSTRQELNEIILNSDKAI